jgi:hypothetical protein
MALSDEQQIALEIFTGIMADNTLRDINRSVALAAEATAAWIEEFGPVDVPEG